jgi:lipoprotein-releasing system permease protein
MRFEFFLAKRFLVGQRFGVFRLATTSIAIGGTALGVAALLITLAVMDGFRTDIQEKILGTQPHVVVVNPFGVAIPNDPAMPAQLTAVLHVQAAAPYIYGQALLQTASATTGVMLRGILPAEEARITRLSAILTQGHWQDLDAQGIVLGSELANSVGARQLGDPITLIAPQPDANVLSQAPRMRRYKVAGFFQSGMYEYDANLVYLRLAAAQDLLGLGDRITGWGLRLDNVEHAAVVAQRLQQRLGPALWVQSWEYRNRTLFQAMKLERTVMFIILTLVILVSSFTIISNLLLLTIEKAREIGILQALGASPPQIGKIFLLNGFMLGGSGVGLGLILGVGLSEFLHKYPIVRLPPDVYYIDKVPIHLSAGMIGSVALCAFGLVLASILYPARKASQMDPVQAIRYG